MTKVLDVGRCWLKGKKPSSLQVTRQTLLFVAGISLPFTSLAHNPHLSMTMISDSEYKVLLDVNDPVFYGPWQRSDLNTDQQSIRIKYFGFEPGSTSIYEAKPGECVLNKIYDEIVFVDPAHKLHDKAVRETVETLSRCTFSYRVIKPGERPPEWQKAHIVVDVDNSPYGVILRFLDGSFDDVPNQCVASLDAMDFGLIGPSTPLSATSNVSVSCSRDAHLKITTNRGRPFSDPASGAEIEFTDPPALPPRSCSPSCVLPVEGRMKKRPKNEGAYKWYVPVVVEYQ
ncbi:hypothetical protein NDM55_003749 [Vibrio cholerae]|nr:hypothetical protein [Vibrio cholerae]EJK2994733.1 hypothetical protein [Vibrio cholerae]EJL6903698.1 hypothetical protein [Vibrio cholerae]